MSLQYPEVFAGPPKPSSIIQPLSLTQHPSVERYVVPGAGAIMIDLVEGDQITIKNDEGGQPCEITAADKNGKVNTEIFGEHADGDGRGIKSLLSNGHDESLTKLRASLTTRKISLNKLKSIQCFDADTPAGTEIKFSSSSDGIAIFTTLGDNMDAEQQNTVTPITITVQRANLSNLPHFELPTPLADPTNEIRVHTATAESFFVRAGEFIQIIDVDGRQCTDFQCFSARKLDKNIQNPLDATTTRTLMGKSYPIPGLHSKYYDQDMEPLVEVVQDTCGRHDAFALACSAKYYDDIGYPGHINCSDNFNNALTNFDVDPRMGWMAINFFFNTNIDEQGVVIADEPWSRPGDYVLLRALTDLVCVSSACPDDTSPANGWNPTDIHVRTYSDAEKFTRSIAYRTTPNAEPKMTKETGFHSKLAKHTGDFVEYNGYWLANTYTQGGVIDEYWACRQKSVLMDLSPLRKFEITGPDSEALCQYIFTRDIKKLATGKVVYTAMCYEHGGMIDDGTLFRLGTDNFRWIGGSDFGGEWIREQAANLNLNVLVRSSTDQLHNVAIQGPESRELLKKFVWTAPNQPTMDQLSWFQFTPARINTHDGIPIVVSRTGFTGELGYEIFCHPSKAAEVFDEITKYGDKHELRLMGLESLDMVRIEAGLVMAGTEFNDQTDPFEAGIGFTVPLKTKQDDFIGRKALIQRKENPRQVFVGLEIDSKVEVGHGDCIHIGRPQIGEVTSSMRSPILGKNIALARIEVTHSEVGTQVEVGKLDGHQKRLPATIVSFPHYDPKKERPRS